MQPLSEALMHLTLHDFPEDELVPVSQDYDPKALDLEFVDLKYENGLHLDGQVLKSQETLHFSGHLSADIEHICGRCLEPVKERMNLPFDFYYEIKGRESLETVEDLREALVLDHPIHFYCRSDCKGLCPKCGVNLNEKTCRCDLSQEISGPLSRLGQFWQQRKKSEGPK